MPPCSDEPIYALGQQGFALASMRSATRSRYYIQVPAEDRLEDWEEARLWDELYRRFDGLAARGVVRGPALEMSITPVRCMVCGTMWHGRVFLAGDAAHILPPTGAKGLNLAASDVLYLGEAFGKWYTSGDAAGLEAYETCALRRVWGAVRFSCYPTGLMHRFPGETHFDQALRAAEFDAIVRSRTMQVVLAENILGLAL